MGGREVSRPYHVSVPCLSTAIITHSYFGYIQSSPRTCEFGGCL
nr:MAG TPA: hypothetical protein [Bacteriophage sp.]